MANKKIREYSKFVAIVIIVLIVVSFGFKISEENTSISNARSNN